MARTTPNAVNNILETNIGDTDLTPFIETANLIVTEHLTAAAITPALSAARLELIERWLAAHFVRVREERVTEMSAAGTRTKYEGQDGMGLRATKYGQQAIALDPTGILSGLSGDADSQVRKRFQARANSPESA